MARLTEIVEKGLQQSGRRHDEIDNAETFHFEEEGKSIFQINTYGRTEVRDVPGKLSQTIQLTRPAARQLIAQLQAAFPQILQDPLPGAEQ